MFKDYGDENDFLKRLDTEMAQKRLAAWRSQWEEIAKRMVPSTPKVYGLRVDGVLITRSCYVSAVDSQFLKLIERGSMPEMVVVE